MGHSGWFLALGFVFGALFFITLGSGKTVIPKSDRAPCGCVAEREAGE